MTAFVTLPHSPAKRAMKALLFRPFFLRAVGRWLRVGLGCLSGLVLFACPVYPTGNCYDNRDGCGEGRTCDLRSGRCVSVEKNAPSGARCVSPAECSSGAQTCGEDGRCHLGSCALHGCVDGFTCTIVDDAPTCLGPDAGTPSTEVEASPSPQPSASSGRSAPDAGPDGSM